MPEYDARFDLNKDGTIDIIDYSIMYSKAGPVNYADPVSVAADFDGDGIVSSADVKLLKAHFGAVKPKTNLLPILALVLGVIVLMRRGGK